MFFKNKQYIFLFLIAVVSFIVKLLLILKYDKLLTLSSDDLNYIKSAAILAQRGAFVFYESNQPTVVVTPVYPMLLAGIFKLTGVNFFSIQVIRVIQAVFSIVTVIIVFFLSKELFNYKIALLSSFIVAFYIPNIVSVGYLITETVFTTLFLFLIYISIKALDKPSILLWGLIGFVWALASLTRPTAALYPILLLIHVIINKKMQLLQVIKYGLIMCITFTIVMSPWWVRNYVNYKEFIPLSEASGNPMLQGTYVNYKQDERNTTYYKLGKNSFETNKIELEVAKKRISQGFKQHFFTYFIWYTLGKTVLFWGTTFYWKEFFNVDFKYVIAMHFILLLGFVGIATLSAKKIKEISLFIFILIYFNIIHCIYMAFDRYAFPILPILSILCACFFINLFTVLLNRKFKIVK